jgi:guanine nucleotide-binding protein subunit alpha
VQEAVRRSREFRLSDSYYFDAIDHMSLPSYPPTDQDILRSRVKITGIITETTLNVRELLYKLFDVGGQRSERKKWIHCFMNITAHVFLFSLKMEAWYALFLFLFPFTFDNLFLRPELHARGSYPL